MTQNQWLAIRQFREELRTKCDSWNSTFATQLEPLQREAARNDTPPYPVETPIVYNTALDEISAQDEIRLIVIGDNPGKAEQLSCNRQYLVGQSGKIAQGFFSAHSELNIDFRRNTIILNKTPVHTAKTTHLKYILRYGSPEIRSLIEESQVWMAQKTAELHRSLAAENDCQLWLVGYAELKAKGLFASYRDSLIASYGQPPDEFWQDVLVFQHFSMNRFLIDLKDYVKTNPGDSFVTSIAELGRKHRLEIFGV